MKNVILAVVAMFFAYAVSAQVPVPDFKNQPALLKDGKLVKLEKQNSEIKGKVNGMGFGGSSQMLTIDGGSSPVTASAKPEFIIKVDADADPETLFYLAKCLEHKKVREVEVGKSSAFAAYGASGKSVKRYHEKLKFEKISDGVYKVTVDEKLEAGEYAFVPNAGGAAGSMSAVFCFAVK
jgi:hypothetical protein